MTTLTVPSSIPAVSAGTPPQSRWPSRYGQVGKCEILCSTIASHPLLPGVDGGCVLGGLRSADVRVVFVAEDAV